MFARSHLYCVRTRVFPSLLQALIVLLRRVLKTPFGRTEIITEKLHHLPWRKWVVEGDRPPGRLRLRCIPAKPLLYNVFDAPQDGSRDALWRRNITAGQTEGLSHKSFRRPVCHTI